MTETVLIPERSAWGVGRQTFIQRCDNRIEISAAPRTNRVLLQKKSGSGVTEQTKKKKNIKKIPNLHLLQCLGLTNIKGHSTVMWNCITVPVNLGHNVRAVQLRGGEREKISSSRRPCILATPLKRHSFCEPQGVLLWPAPNYANTYFNLDQTRSVGAKPVTRRGPRHGSSAQDAQLIRSNQVLGFTKDKKP